MSDLKPCPSCREPLDHQSGDGCANMTAHKERAMTDKQLIARLRDAVNGEHDMTPHGADVMQAADRLEALIAEREKATLWAIEQHALADNYALRISQEKAKLAKAVAFLEEIAITGDWFISDMNDLIKELKGDTP